MHNRNSLYKKSSWYPSNVNTISIYDEKESIKDNNSYKKIRMGKYVNEIYIKNNLQLY